DPVYKSLTVTQDGYYLRYERNFRFIQLKNFDRQLENIRKAIERDRKQLVERTGGNNMMDLGAQLDLEWLNDKLRPYFQKWTELGKQSQLPAKPPPKSQPQPKPEQKNSAPQKQPEAKPPAPKNSAAQKKQDGG
ncbi:MAG: hypothetical protein AAGF10_04995, partial [Verrucomicrobiota bacterium]